MEFPASFLINRFSNVIDAMLCYAMHLFLLDLYNEMMQCYLNTCNGLMQNALHFHFILFFVNFSKSLLRVFQPNTLFTSFIVKQMDSFFENKTSFSRSDQHHFLFFSPSSKHWNFYFMSDPWPFNDSFS